MTKRNSTMIDKNTQPKNKLKYDVGYNSCGKYPSHKDGKINKEYSAWSAMMRRCYSKKDRGMFPAYADCTVAAEWHDFQNFAEWYTNHDFYGLDYCLDKDLLVSGNKVYSADTCSLVPHEINSILLNVASRRGALPQGIYLDKVNKKYKAQLSIDSKVVSLGRFKTIIDARNAYKIAKERHVKNKALEWANRIEWDVFAALMSWELKQ